MTNAQPLSPQDFAAKIRTKYPGSYDSISDLDLTQKVLDKYPQYQSVVQPRGGAGGTWEEENPVVRFGRGALDAVKGILQSGALGVSNEAPPVDAQGKAIPPSFQSMKDELVNFVKGFAAQKEVDEGDYAAAAGKILTNLAMLRSAKEAPTGDVGTADAVPKPEAVNPVAPIVRGAAKATNAVLAKAPAATLATVGAVAGHATGIPYAGEAGAIAGATLGRTLNGKLRVPGENFGNGPDYEPIPDANGPQRAPVVGPQAIPQPQPPAESGAAEDARAYFEQKLAARKAAQSATPQPESQPETTSAPSEDDVARGMGYKSVSQAQQRLGPQEWQHTYNKIINAPQDIATRPIETKPQAQQAVSDMVDQLAPAAPLKTKLDIDQQLYKGDVTQAKKILDDALEDQEMQARNRQDLSDAGQAMFRYQQRMNRAKSSADANKGSLLTAQQVVDSMPAPYADMEANKLLGYEGRRTIAEATQARKDAMQPQADMNAPWGGTKPYTEAVKQFIRLYYGEGNSLKVRPTQQR